MKKTHHISAFTLVELLVVIAIIVLLIGILVPSVHAIRNSIKKGITRSRIGMIESAIEQFQNDFAEKKIGEDLDGKDLDDDGDDVDSHEHRHPLPHPDDLVAILTGYKDADQNISSETDYYFNRLDLKDGFGFRLVRGGAPHGPYGGTENIPIDKDLNPPAFLDAWGNPMTYEVDLNKYKPGYKICSGGADGDPEKATDNIDNLYSE